MEQAQKHLADLKQRIYKYYEVADTDNTESLDFDVFGVGKMILEHGTLELDSAFELYKLGMIEIYQKCFPPTLDDFPVVALTPEFEAACTAYKVPSIYRIFFQTNEYDEPFMFQDIDDFDYFDLDDFRGAHVYLMTEAMLREELETRDRAWLVYRTPYRPEDVLERG